jgi:hypothetical protein
VVTNRRADPVGADDHLAGDIPRAAGTGELDTAVALRSGHLNAQMHGDGRARFDRREQHTMEMATPHGEDVVESESEIGHRRAKQHRPAGIPEGKPVAEPAGAALQLRADTQRAEHCQTVGLQQQTSPDLLGCADPLDHGGQRPCPGQQQRGRQAGDPATGDHDGATSDAHCRPPGCGAAVERASGGRSHSDARVGSMVRLTTPINSWASTSRSVCWRSCAANASTVRLAS